MNVRLSLLAVTVLVACGPQEKGFDPVNSGTAEPAGNAMSASAEASSRNFEGGATGSGFIARGLADPDCTNAMVAVPPPAQWVDADLDGLPDSAVTLTITNCIVPEPNGSTTINAQLIIVDTALASATYSFDSTVEWSGDFVGTGAGAGYLGSIDYSGFQRATQPAGTSFRIQEGASSTGHVEGPGGEVHDSLEEIGWDMTYSPLDGTWDYTVDPHPLEDGSLDFQGGYHLVVDNTEAQSAVATAAPGLTVDDLCETNLTAGTMYMVFDGPDGDAAVQVVWTGCGTTNVTYIGNYTPS